MSRESQRHRSYARGSRKGKSPAPWRVFEARNAEDAIELASKLRRQGHYNWFRGQRRQWAPDATLFRLQLKHGDQWEEQFRPEYRRFINWISMTPGLESLVNEDTIHAIRQHYGSPSPFLDFTTDPAIAGFFACDSRKVPPTTKACVYCLNTEELSASWRMLQRVRGKEAMPDVEFIDRPVPNLWRHQAQKGVFLYCPSNWEILYPMDRILFPVGAYPAYPTKREVYPDRKSQLELLLDQYFDAERRHTSIENIKRMFDDMKATGGNPIWCELDPPRKPRRTAPPHESWKGSQRWLTLPEEEFERIPRREVVLSLNLAASALVFGVSVERGARRLLDRDPGLRKAHILWRIDAGKSVRLLPKRLDRAFNRIWDAMRRSPYRRADIARALKQTAMLFKAGYERRRRDNEIVCRDLFGPCLRMEFSPGDGSGRNAWIPETALISALREDLPRQLRSRDLKGILLLSRDPGRIFTFTGLRRIFVDYLIPMQALGDVPAGMRELPMLSHPARLNILGLM